MNVLKVSAFIQVQEGHFCWLNRLDLWYTIEGLNTTDQSQTDKGLYEFSEDLIIYKWNQWTSYFYNVHLVYPRMSVLFHKISTFQSL